MFPSKGQILVCLGTYTLAYLFQASETKKRSFIILIPEQQHDFPSLILSRNTWKNIHCNKLLCWTKKCHSLQKSRFLYLFGSALFELHVVSLSMFWSIKPFICIYFKTSCKRISIDVINCNCNKKDLQNVDTSAVQRPALNFKSKI